MWNFRINHEAKRPKIYYLFDFDKKMKNFKCVLQLTRKCEEISSNSNFSSNRVCVVTKKRGGEWAFKVIWRFLTTVSEEWNLTKAETCCLLVFFYSIAFNSNFNSHLFKAFFLFFSCLFYITHWLFSSQMILMELSCADIIIIV